MIFFNIFLRGFGAEIWRVFALIKGMSNSIISTMEMAFETKKH